MPRPQGVPKTGGRKKGTPNRSSLLLHEVLENLNVDVPKMIADALPQLPIEKRVEVLTSLLPYLYPKRKAIEHSVKEGSMSFTDWILALEEDIDQEVS
jgi:hypothetical protein